MWPLLSRGLPLLASMLVLFALLGNEIGALVLVPTFLVALPTLSSLHHAKEARAGDWWIAMGGRLFTIDPLSILLILISPLMPAAVFGIEHDGLIWGFVGVPFVGIHLASGAIHELAMKMPRAEAQFVPLLSLILIWPLLIANDAIAACSDASMCAEPWPSILMATGISLIIWFALPILHPRTGSN